MALRSIHNLGVDEAYEILSDRLRVDNLPPLDAIENEDWGRDMLLSRLAEVPTADLQRLGLCLRDVAASTDEEGTS